MEKMPWLLKILVSLWVGAMIGYAVKLLSSITSVGVIGEELSKLLGILLVGKLIGRRETSDGLMVGVGFGITESVLYYTNVLVSGNVAAVGLRLLFTLPMHGATGALSARYRYGIVAAIIIHVVFNYVVSSVGI